MHLCIFSVKGMAFRFAAFHAVIWSALIWGLSVFLSELRDEFWFPQRAKLSSVVISHGSNFYKDPAESHFHSTIHMLYTVIAVDATVAKFPVFRGSAINGQEPVSQFPKIACTGFLILRRILIYFMGICPIGNFYQWVSVCSHLAGLWL